MKNKKLNKIKRKNKKENILYKKKENYWNFRLIHFFDVSTITVVIIRYTENIILTVR